MIGIIGAMSVEIDELRGKLVHPVDETVSRIRFTRGLLAGKEVVLAVCGIGKVYAAICAQTMILKYAPELLVNTGVAGGLDPSLHIGDIVVATDLVQHDMDTTPLGDVPGLISGINVVEFPADGESRRGMTDCVKALGLSCRQWRIASGDQFVAGGERKEFIRNTFGAVACEMEGAAIAQVCRLYSVKFSVLRSMSDSADGEAEMDFPTFVNLSADRAAKIALALAKSLS